MKPVLEQTVTQRNVTELKKAWKSIYSQLLDYHAWDTGPSSSLFGSEATPSLQVGPRQKRFAKVLWVKPAKKVLLVEKTFCVILYSRTM